MIFLPDFIVYLISAYPMQQTHVLLDICHRKGKYQRILVSKMSRRLQRAFCCCRVCETMEDYKEG